MDDKRRLEETCRDAHRGLLSLGAAFLAANVKVAIQYEG